MATKPMLSVQAALREVMQQVNAARPVGELAHQFIEKAYQSALTLAEVENEIRRRYILRALEQNSWNQCRAAKVLGQHRNTLGRNIAELGIELPCERRPNGRAVL